MFGFRVAFDSPGYLLLLLLLPLIWAIGAGRLRALGRWRRATAIAVRSLVVTAIVLALAGIQLVWLSDRLTVLYLLDQSDSIPVAQRRLMLDYAIENVRQHRDRVREDSVGLITFGGDATIDVPPFADDLPAGWQLANLPQRLDATNLEAALKLAQAIMPADSQRRVVLISDGNQTNGDAQAAAARLTQSGIGVDVMPVPVDAVADVMVEKIDLPSDIRRGQTFEARVVISSLRLHGDDRPVSGRLNVTRQIAGEQQLLMDQPVQLLPGKNVIPLSHRIDEPAPYTYTARFVADAADDDRIVANNEATAYTYVRGQGRVLLIEPWDRAGSYQLLVDLLRRAEIEVAVQPSNSLFGSLAELQAFDAVILAGVPRTSGDATEAVSNFSEEQIQMLVRNTQQLGSGLLMIGGPEAFGAGGWTGTALEEAMPVDFEIKNLKVSAVGALQIVMDTSGSMGGEKIDLCKSAAIEAVKALQPSDHIGVISFDSSPRVVVAMQRVAGRRQIAPQISQIQAGGGTDLFPAMELGYRQLRDAPAATKHMIILTDGHTPPAGFDDLAARMHQEGITVSTVAIGGDADANLMTAIATAGGGKFYNMVSPRAVPRILMREARRISRGLIHEDDSGIPPDVVLPHAVLGGIATPPPPLTGFVMTTPKDNPLVQTVITSPVPAGQENPLLALWQYGLGRSAVLTTDAGARWTSGWLAWPGNDKFYEQLVRWLMRPTGDTGKFTLDTQVRGGEVEVVVHALDQDDDFLNFLPITASALSPELKPLPLSLRQTAPGRYTGSFPADSSGNYFVNVIPQAGAAPLSTGVTVPFGDEYRLRDLNEPLLRSLAAGQPAGGAAGQWLEPLAGEVAALAAAANPFRSDLRSERTIRDIWPLLVLAACCLYFLDVLTRRVSLSLDWLWQRIQRLRRPQPQLAPVLPHWDALREQKERTRRSLVGAQPAIPPPASGSGTVQPAASQALPDRLAGSSRGQPASGNSRLGSRSIPAGGSESLAADPAASAAAPSTPSTYTQRLLEAKRKAKRSS